MSKPSVLLINRTYPPVHGATGRMMQDLCVALEKSGWLVSVLTTGERNDRDISQSITIYRIKQRHNHQSFFGFFVLWIRLFFKAFKLPRHDLVITMTDPPMVSVIGHMIAKRKKSVHIHWAQDLYPDLLRPLGASIPKFLERYLLKLSRRVMNQAYRVVAIGQCMSKRLAQTGVVPAKLIVIPNWADLEVVAPLQGKPHDYASREVNGRAKKPEEMFSNTSPKFRVLYAGNIGRAHPMKSVIEAAELLRDQEEIEFVFVGDPKSHERLMREKGKRGLENIKFMPYQPIELLRGVMESGDVHLVTMRSNIYGALVPCKFYSGLAVGRPTIFVGPEQTEISDVLNHYNAGVVVPPDDGKALADMIYGYRTDGEAWFAAQEGALRAAQAYHPNQSLNKWVDLVEKVRFSRKG